jgi:ADP-ribose pyrophosphatase YjhB (NUDIX family)
MIISANGLVFNEYGDTLLVRRDDTRSLAPPGGAVELGELPPQTVEREVKEETGLDVTAVRLVELTYLPSKPDNYLFLSFRALPRGGTIEPSSETPQVGFFKSYPLPQPMLPLHRRQIERGIAHPGGAPYWETHEMGLMLRLGSRLLNKLVYPFLGLRRKQRGEPAYEAPPDWQITSTVLVHRGHDELLWLRSGNEERWHLPTAVAHPGETPWAAAERALADANLGPLELTGICGIYPARAAPTMTFAFSAGTEPTPQVSGSTAAYYRAGSEPDGAENLHIAQARDATDGTEEVHFRLI